MERLELEVEKLPLNDEKWLVTYPVRRTPQFTKEYRAWLKTYYLRLYGEDGNGTSLVLT